MVRIEQENGKLVGKDSKGNTVPIDFGSLIAEHTEINHDPSADGQALKYTPDDDTDTFIMEWDVQESGPGPMTLYKRAQDFNATTDHTMGLTYNINHDGTPVVEDGTEAAVGYTLESKFNDGSRNLTEAHVQYYTLSGTSKRAFTSNYRHDDDEVRTALQGDKVQLREPTGPETAYEVEYNTPNAGEFEQWIYATKLNIIDYASDGTTTQKMIIKTPHMFMVNDMRMVQAKTGVPAIEARDSGGNDKQLLVLNPNGSDKLEIGDGNRNVKFLGGKLEDPQHTATNDAMTADPETATEDAYITVNLSGTDYQIPVYTA